MRRVRHLFVLALLGLGAGPALMGASGPAEARVQCKGGC